MKFSVSASYGTLFRSCEYKAFAEEPLPFEKFQRLCNQLSLSDTEYAAIKDLTHENILYLVYYLRHQWQLYSIDLASPKYRPSLGGTSRPPEELSMAIGLCSRNARAGDVVTVVRGCRHPLLLKRVRERFEEVEIELV
jgi:hypothetical protein